MIKSDELIPRRYYKAVYKESNNIFTAIAIANDKVNTITCNEDRYNISGRLAGAYITEITKAEAFLGVKELSNREAVKFLDKEW